MQRDSRVSWPLATRHSFEAATAQLARKSAGKESVSLIQFREFHVGRTSTLATGMNLVTTMVGAGVLGFPAVFAKAGWHYAPVMVVAMAFVVGEVGMVMNKTLNIIEERAVVGGYSFGTRPQKYEDMLDAAFGSIGKTTCSVFVNMFLLMLCGAYCILIGMSFEVLTDTLMPYRLWVLVMAVLFFPLAMLDDMSVISRLSFIGVVASVGYALCVAQAGIQTSMHRESPPSYRAGPVKTEDLGLVVSVMLLAFEYQMVVPTVRAEMEKPQELPVAIKGAVAVVLSVYGSVGMCGYYAWGTEVEGNVAQSMVHKSGEPMVAGRILSALVIANLLVTFPIFMFVVAKSVEAEFSGGEYSRVQRMCLVSCALGVGLFCPYFLPVLGLIGSSLGVVLAVFMPLAVYWKLLLYPDQPEGSPRQSRPRAEEHQYPSLALRGLLHAVVFVLGIGAALWGTRDALNDMTTAMAEPAGNPIKNFFCPMGADPSGRWKCTSWCPLDVSACKNV